MEVRRPTHPTDADLAAEVRDLRESESWHASALAASMRREGEAWFASLRLGTQLAAANERADFAEAALAARDADGPVVPLPEVEVLIARLADACAEADRLGDRCAVLEAQVSELLPLAVIGVDESCGGEEYRAFVARVQDGEFGEVQS